MTVARYLEVGYKAIGELPGRIFTLIAHIVVLQILIRADDESIMRMGFWQYSAWIELVLWMRFIFFYLSEVKQFFWINSLILSSMRATTVFIIVYICGVTAFAGSYNLVN